MYSKAKGFTDRDLTLTPPPGYDGSRFRSRSDGRDDSFPPYREAHHRKKAGAPSAEGAFPAACCEALPEEEKCCDAPSLDERAQSEQCPFCKVPEECCEGGGRENPISSFIKGLGNEEILLIALIVLLSGNQSRQGLETVLILALLLCIS